MTLKEKFKDVLLAYEKKEINISRAENSCNETAEDFAIGFAEWININAYKYPTKTTTKELLEMFKKEIPQLLETAVSGTVTETITFQDALKSLGIEDYAKRIFNSNSHGELFHIQQYFTLAEVLKGNTEWFREWFENVVKWAEENWKRPESIFQHISRILAESSSTAH